MGIEKFTEKKGVLAALEEIKMLQRRKAINSPETCHFLLHYVGDKAYEEFSTLDKAEKSLGDRMALCYGGFRHGFLSKYFTERQQDTSVMELIKQSCGQYFNEEKNWPGEDCFHGIGHALVSSQKNVFSPLIYCAKLPKSWQQHFCGFGVFMEYMYSHDHFLANHTTAVFRIEDMKDLCNDILSQWQTECYSYLVTNHRLNIQNEQHHVHTAPEKDFLVCEDTPNAKLRASCYAGTGTTIVIGSTAKSLTEIKETCNKYMPPEFITECMIRSAYFYFNFRPYEPVVSEKMSEEFCHSFIDIKDQEYCAKGFIPLYDWYSYMKKASGV
jgi:hypothetical protein